MWGEFGPSYQIMPRAAVAILSLLIAALALPAAGGDARAQEITVTIKDHRFEPTELRVPANKRVSIYVVNEDATPEEFESVSMKVEKIIPGKSKGLVRVGPLPPGRYDFFGDFNQATAKGVLIAE
jgi:Cupredoxin-like domain